MDSMEVKNLALKQSKSDGQNFIANLPRSVSLAAIV